MSGPKLKPCPFCGGEAWLRNDPAHSTAFWIGCDSDSCVGNLLWEETKAKATEAWNTRAPVDYSALPEVQAIVTAAESRALGSVTTLHTVIADIRAATVGSKPMLSELSASIAEMREMDRAQAFSAGYEAGVIVERDACATAAYDQLSTETEGLGIITAGRVAAAIRKRGEG